MMEEFLRFLLTPLLSQPDKLAIHSATSSVAISVAAEDMGRIIGKNGSVISALRNLVRAYAIAHQLPFTAVSINEPR